MSNIDPTKPIEGFATTESVRDNFQAAADEIDALEAGQGAQDNRLTQNETDIGVNAGAISTNATNIGTNATDIGNNAAAIAAVPTMLRTGDRLDITGVPVV